MEQLRPTFSESWYRVADLKCRLRGSAQISRQYYRGDRWYVVRDPAGNQFHRLSAPAYKFVGLLDGTRSVAEAWDLVGGQLADDAPTQNEVIQILSQLHAANLLEANITPDAQVLLRRHKRMVKKQWQGRLMNVLFPRIPLWDPDRFLCRWLPAVRPVLSFIGTIVWLTVVIWAVVTIIPRWSGADGLKAAASDAIDPANWPFLWATFVLIKLLHELGHAFFCRRFGGEVHELGVMFLVFIPTPYVDASSAWAFPNKWHRVLVGAGGMIFELFIAAIMAFVWANTANNAKWLGIPIHHLAYNAMLIASVSTLIFNANPLLRYDGYYILSDLLEIPNLRYRASEYSMGLIKRHLFGVKSQQPLPPFGQRIWLFFYAIASSIYRVFVGITIILVVTNRVPVLGVLMALGGIVTWAVVPVAKVANYLLLEAELHRKRLRATVWVVAFVAAVVAVIGFIPFSPHYEGQAVAEATQHQKLTAGYAGVVTQIKKHHYDVVNKGDVILVCEDPKLEAEIAALEADLRGLEVKLGWANNLDPSLVAAIQAEINAKQGYTDASGKHVDGRLDILKQRQDKLTTRAEVDGYVIAPDIDNLDGKYLQRGEEIGQVIQYGKLDLKTMLDVSDAALIFLDQKKHFTVQVRMAGSLDTEMTGYIDPAALPVAQRQLEHQALSQQAGGDLAVQPDDKSQTKLVNNAFQVYVQVDDPSKVCMPGQKAYVRFTLDKKPLVWEWGRKFWQLWQQHSHGKWL